MSDWAARSSLALCQLNSPCRAPEPLPNFPHAPAVRSTRTHQGEAQLAQAELDEDETLGLLVLVAEQAGGWGLPQRDGKYITKHVFAGSERVSSKMDPAWFQYPPTMYYHSDHLGSAQYVTIDNQEMVQHAEYLPSGELWQNASDSRFELARRFLFTGKELDIHTGLYDFGARQYDARQGQWLSPDPAFDGLNLYAYVHNNPINLIDPSGLSAEHGRHNPIPVSGTGLGSGTIFAIGSKAEEGFYGPEKFDEMTADKPVYQASDKGINAEMAAAIGSMGASAKGTVDPFVAAAQAQLGKGQTGFGDKVLQAGMMAGAAMTGSDIRTDGTGSSMGVPGGTCDSCAGGRAYQAAFVALTVGSLVGGSVRAGYAGLASARSSHVQRLQMYHNVGDYLSEPSRLVGMSPSDLMLRIGGAEGWKVESLRRGSRKSSGFILRQYSDRGQPTGKMIQWHPGGGHHGRFPYWKVNAGHGPVRIGPQF